MWSLLTNETWIQNKVAADSKGRAVSPHNKNAVRFSIIGAMIRLTIPKGKTWSPEFEKLRACVVFSIVKTPTLQTEVKRHFKKSATKIPLQEINSKVDWPFVDLLLKMLRVNLTNEKGGG